MARLGVSAEFIRPGLVGGTEQALYYTVDGLVRAVGPADTVTIFGRSLPLETTSQVESVTPVERPGPRFVQETLTFRSWTDRLDSWFFPNYFTPPGRSTCRIVTTIPDLQYLHLPQNFSSKKRAWLRFAHRRTLAKADVVAVYSGSVRDDILDRYGAQWGSKISVLPIPVSWERFGTAEPVPRERPYLLSVSSHYQHKNLATLIRAFQRVHSTHPDLQLVLAGQLGSNLVGVRQAEDVVALIAELGLQGSVGATGYIAPDELGSLYRAAELFVFPSVFEGFGLPPVEALGFGLPVLTTRCTSLPEVTRGHAEYIDDPYDADELAGRIIEIVESGRRPSNDQVADIRAFYDPKRIGKQLYQLMTSGVPA